MQPTKPTLQGAILPKRKQLAVARALLLGKTRLCSILLTIPECVELLVKRYQDAERGKSASMRIGSIAKLSLHYNASIKGRNRKAGQQVDAAMSQVVKDISLAPIVLPQADLHPKLYFSKEMRRRASRSNRAVVLYRGIDRRRERLVGSIGRELGDIAVRHHSALAGDVIGYEDIEQEAILLAYQYTLIYDPRKGKHPTKWSTFAYHVVDKALRNYIAEKTRNIPLPRSVQDRYRIVKRAMDKTPTEDYKVLAALANKTIIDKKGSIKEEDRFTPEEVENLLSAIGGSVVSLNSFVHDGDEGSRALFEAIDSGQPNSEAIVGYKEAAAELLSLLKDTLAGEELEVVMLRYGLDGLGRQRTMTEIANNLSTERSKVTVSSILDKAEAKLRASKDKFSTVKGAMYGGLE